MWNYCGYFFGSVFLMFARISSDPDALLCLRASYIMPISTVWIERKVMDLYMGHGVKTDLM